MARAQTIDDVIHDLDEVLALARREECRTGYFAALYRKVTVAVKDAIAAAEKSLGDDGRLVIRKSGTEPLIRVMAEATDAKLMDDVVESVADAVRAVS